MICLAVARKLLAFLHSLPSKMRDDTVGPAAVCALSFAPVYSLRSALVFIIREKRKKILEHCATDKIPHWCRRTAATRICLSNGTMRHPNPAARKHSFDLPLSVGRTQHVAKSFSLSLCSVHHRTATSFRHLTVNPVHRFLAFGRPKRFTLHTPHALPKFIAHPHYSVVHT